MKMDGIGVKFCGNCNPEMDCGHLLSVLQAKFPNVAFLLAQNGCNKIDLWLVLNGCRRCCATLPVCDRSIVMVVTPESIDHQAIKAVKIEDEIEMQIKERLHETKK
jgi:hypothetical protein